MKKLLFIMVVGFGAAMLVKNGKVTVTPDNQIQVIGFAVPIPNAVQQSPIMGMVTSMLPPSAPAGAGAQARPTMPVVTSAYGTFNANAPGRANAPGGGMATGADGFGAAAKALRGSQ